MYEYATVADIQERYRTLVGDEIVRAQALIADATVFLMSEFKNNDIDVDPANWDETFTLAVKSVVCAMVKRSLISNNGDVSSESASVGVYSQSFTYSNPTGDLYLKESERRLLGIELQKQIITTIAPMTNADREEVENGV